MTYQKLIDKIKGSSCSQVKLAVADIDGILRGKVIHKDKFLEVAEKSIGFCDVIFGWDAADLCYNNVEVSGWHTAYPDARATLDLSTYREIPWNNNIPFFIADFSNDEKISASACPRSLLRSVKNEAEKMGYFPVFAQEFEWFNFEETPNSIAAKTYQNLQPITPGMFGYSMLRPSQYQKYFNELFDLLEKFDIALEGMHTETGPGVYEAAIRFDEILAAADKALLFKNSVKEIAYRHGLLASFMAKWDEKLPGSGGHIHQSLWDKTETKNLFFAEKGNHNMSTLMEHYLAGQLMCMPQIMPMYTPTINSYKRLREGAWAPVSVSWGFDNRTSAIRVVGDTIMSKRIEMRLPGADVNPYLAMAASLASGLYGIKHKLKLEIPETKGNAYEHNNLTKLPTNLSEATQIMKSSAIAKELFGNEFVAHFCATREWECKEYAKAVTSWELKRYFEII